jgi:hypothetical protein
VPHLSSNSQRIAKKTSGIEAVFREWLRDVGGIKLAFIFGSDANGEKRFDSDMKTPDAESQRSISVFFFPPDLGSHTQDGRLNVP